MRAFVLGNYMNANFMYVDRLPAAGESLAATRIFQEHGGKGLNLGVGLHRLGVAVDMLMAVGRDTAGEAVTRRLVAEGMSADLFLPLGPDSGYGVGFIGPDGSNFLAAFLGANALLTADHVEQASDALGRADWVLAQYEVPNEVILHAFRLARIRGIRTYLNPSPWRMPVNELMALTDVLVVNATEAAQMFGEPAAEDMTRAEWAGRLPSMARQWGWRGMLLVVTLAHDGCVALDHSGTVAAEPAFAIQQIDATGAGDAFGCGLVFGLIQGQSLNAALRTGNACGAIIAAREGILDGLPTCAKLEAFTRQVAAS
jgi:ribokinase